MALELQNNSVETLGSFRGCLIEGDPEQRKRERRIRRRALAISIALQSAILAALILIPLFGKTEHIVIAGGYTPIPPYHHNNGPTRQNTTNTPHPRTSNFTLCLVCPSPKVPLRNSNVSDDQPLPPDPFGRGDGPNIGPNCPGCINMPGPEGPRPPLDVPKRRLQITRIDPALLIHRVEPVYPALARQTGRSGRVELRAIIATDGTIQYLQVVSGDPLFIQSALQAVQQWRYKPTILNGQPVEIDTFITVVYNINR